MTYPEALRYIHSLERFGIVPGLERVALLCRALGDPQRQGRFVHVAGTNGKGSVSTMMAEILRAQGLRVGLYTSPYVTNFRERMQINGELIPEEDLCFWTERLRGAGLPATEFEFVTAVAFAWFAARQCDVTVLEVGLGGRWDATNLIEAPLCTIITKIALDHTKILGGTLGKIAAEKCGAIKPGRPVITSCEQPPQALSVIQKTASERGCELIVPAPEECEIKTASLFGSEAALAGLPVRVPLLGPHMCRNALIAVRAARALGVPDSCIQRGIARARMPARMEVLSQSPLILLDGGHNPDGARALAATIDALLPGQQFTMISGMMADKDVAEYLRVLRPFARAFIACQPQNPRALPARELVSLAKQAGYEHVACANSTEHALWLAGESDLLICGSFYLAGEARPLLLAW
ncbi:MAG: bifunctional folylpolyglutamate synthase/dihydrofolate synthase [Oscillospiraceae bacterium]|nr:bifunctional folylpolyglutamate synthase/dihydrofolate synthase [Oscillospiraceae bacterium]